MVKILDGKKIRERLTTSLQNEVGDLDIKPKLIIIQIGSSKESSIYIKEKKDYGKKIGVTVEHKKYPENVTEDLVLSDIKKFNLDPTVNGVIVQLPIPNNLDKVKIIEQIDPKKDVDGLTSKNINFIIHNKEKILPATTQGIVTLLENYNIDIKGKKVVIVGESFLVGRPTALALLNRGATITVCHSDTKNLEQETKKSDILIVATGVKNLITVNHVSKNQIVIDVGINRINESKTIGDVNYNEVKDIVSAITPVPGGVGPMTVFSLFNNLLKNTQKKVSYD
ncbi:MAG: bifunctional 5,10-methylenetetrahydrofolate dehydrogenase/5,10-methenyltetrahydrofolate cyclohydrolase [Candidatus Paceibacterota bacterium]